MSHVHTKIMSLCRPWVCQDNLILCEVYFKDIHTFNLHFIYFKDILYHILLVTIPDISICLGVVYLFRCVYALGVWVYFCYFIC